MKNYLFLKQQVFLSKSIEEVILSVSNFPLSLKIQIRKGTKNFN